MRHVLVVRYEHLCTMQSGLVTLSGYTGIEFQLGLRSHGQSLIYLPSTSENRAHTRRPHQTEQ